MKLISMTDFVLSRDNSRSNSEEALHEITQYANFLKQPLKLEMFVPCDDNGSVLENPICQLELEQYRKAKEKVLFEFDGGLTLLRNREWFFIIEDKNGIYYRILKNKTKSKIESLFKFSVDIKLTQNAIKQFM